MPQVLGNSVHGFRHASLMHALSFVHSELSVHSGLGAEKAYTCISCYSPTVLKRFNTS
jgi:hypothetical protein